jgi:hypothetical protein
MKASYFFHVVLTHGDKRLVWLKAIEAFGRDGAEGKLLLQLHNFRQKAWCVSIVEIAETSFDRMLSQRWCEIDEAVVVSTCGCWRCDRFGDSDDCIACGGKHRIDIDNKYVGQTVCEVLQDIEVLARDRDCFPYFENGYYHVGGLEFLLTDDGCVSISSVASQACYRRIHGETIVESVPMPPRKRLLDRVVAWILGGAA